MYGIGRFCNYGFQSIEKMKFAKPSVFQKQRIEPQSIKFFKCKRMSFSDGRFYFFSVLVFYLPPATVLAKERCRKILFPIPNL